ncbi:hypothetical protein EF912_32850 [Streptomyces sp. WAC07061]|uniref:hypothetical protein n=1 Tax=Streptomyces sp. WAC07061 TaxID=2487410 RepID=UPI000F7B62F3|nr:hypothetical protein [Streptomyces sp. WAC07061]RSS39767.1 hypothetical protein EF912_32850 [Streptomyces sp. WAC07061]
MRLPHRHSGYALETVAAAVVIAALVVTRGVGLLGLVVYAAGQLLMIVPGAMRIWHHFAPPCAECVKVLPLNPAESARERGSSRRALWASHALFGSAPRFGLVLFANIFLAALGCAPVYHLLGMEGAQRRAYLFLIAGIVLTVATAWTTRTHNRLAPWCPYCDEGDEASAMDPTDGRGQPAPA